MEGMIIITQVKEKLQNADYVSGNGWRYLPDSRIVAVDPEKRGEPPQVLTGNFSSAMSPVISYDGQKMIFAGQKNTDSPWQIWEMNLRQ